MRKPTFKVNTGIAAAALGVIVHRAAIGHHFRLGVFILGRFTQPCEHLAGHVFGICSDLGGVQLGAQGTEGRELICRERSFARLGGIYD